MQRHLSKLCLSILALAMLIIAPLASAQAADGWQPKFDAGQQVYVDPALANHPKYPVNLDALAPELKKVSTEHNISVYVVAIERTTESGSIPAVGRVNDLVLRWQGESGFPHDRFLVLLWLRYADDPSQGSVAANVGSALREYDLTSADFNAQNGPVNAAIRKYMPHDPNGAFVAIVENVNGSIESVNARRFYWSISPYVVLVIILLAVGAFFYRKRKAAFDELKKSFDAEVEKWSAMLDSANALKIRLHQGYMGFLSQQADWSKVLKGVTRENFGEAVSDFAEFSSRLAKANSVFEDAVAAGAKANPFSTNSMQEALASLTTRVIVVEGKELPIEEVTLFGGLVERSEYKPDELLNAMDVLFAQTNRKLAAIKRSMEETQEKTRELKDTFAVIDDIMGRADADAKGISGYQEEYSGLNEERTSILEDLSSDPVAASDSLTGLLSRARQFKARLEAQLSS